MIPEFPLPPSEADFYHSKLLERSPIYSTFSFKLPELMTSDTYLMPRLTNSTDIMRSIKQAQINQRRISRLQKSTACQNTQILTSLSNTTTSLGRTLFNNVFRQSLSS